MRSGSCLASHTSCLASLYAWQAAAATPTIFTDEIEFTQVSRSIADTGRATLARRPSRPGVSLYTYLAAPAWWLDRRAELRTAEADRRRW